MRKGAAIRLRTERARRAVFLEPVAQGKAVAQTTNNTPGEPIWGARGKGLQLSNDLWNVSGFYRLPTLEPFAKELVPRIRGNTTEFTV